VKFILENNDSSSDARAGIIQTDHGSIHTPIFMPVGTQATVKTLTPQDVEDAGAQIILGNTYHLYLRPGSRLIQKAGGLHHFSSWHLPILTDSGGFQVFSLAGLNKITDVDVTFQSHIDGSFHTFTPELTIDIQRELGSDIMMVFDQCTHYPCEENEARKAHERTVRWAERCKSHYSETESLYGFKQSLFGIIQGSIFPDIRSASMESLMNLDFDGYAIGGLAVGEPRKEMLEMTRFCTERMPAEKPRYLMGVGKPEDIVDAIAVGVDMFDCVIPTRNGRNGTVYTWSGRLNLRNSDLKDQFHPIDENCECFACKHFSLAYLRHLFQAGEILGMRMATLHNVTFYLKLVAEAREAIFENRFSEWRTNFYKQYRHSEVSNKTNNQGG